jgi:hypothetical protein
MAQDLTIREMFIQQLLTMNGISKDRAVAITEAYPTPKALFQAIAMGERNGQGGR